jgi:tRNA(Ile)-lysidine synthase
VSPQEQGSVAFLSVPGHLADRLAALAPGYPDISLCIALSGGVDSVCLLHAAREIAARHPAMALRAIHVDHGLQRESARWAARCQELCQRLGVPLEVANLGLAVVKGASVEAEARRERYAALAGRLQAGECLLTAHHADDQLETVLLQLFRGAGTAGLAAMPQSSPLGAGVHLRPLLDVGRDELAAYAAAVGLGWIEDPMNAESRFDRAYLRHEVLPAIRRRWPSVARTVGRSARHLAEAQRLLEALAVADGVPMVDAHGRLEIASLAGLPRERQVNILRWWIVAQGLRLPSAARLESIRRDVMNAREGAQPVVTWPAGEVRRYRGRLYAMQPLGPSPPAGWAHGISPGRPVALPGGMGQASLEPGP